MGNYSVIKNFCTSNGPGVRIAVYLSGCSLHCKGCFNHDIWNYESGSILDEETINKIIKSLEPEYIEGLSILGGEPLDVKNQKSTLALVKAVREHFGDKKTIWVWSGYVFNKNIPIIKKENITESILKNINVLVDGPFILEKQDITLKFRGSSNQRILHLKNGKIDFIE